MRVSKRDFEDTPASAVGCWFLLRRHSHRRSIRGEETARERERERDVLFVCWRREREEREKEIGRERERESGFN